MANYKLTVRTADGDIPAGECDAIAVPDRVNEIAQALGGMTVGASMSYATPLTWSFLIERTRIYIVAEEVKAAVQS